MFHVVPALSDVEMENWTPLGDGVVVGLTLCSTSAPDSGVDAPQSTPNSSKLFLRSTLKSFSKYLFLCL